MAEGLIIPTLAIAAGSELILWNGQTERKVKPFTSGNISDLFFNHNGQVVALCSQDATENNIVLLSAQTGKILDSFGKDKIHKPISVRFGGRSRYLCIGCEHGTVSVFDLKTRTEARRFQLQSQVLHACLDPTDKFVYVLTMSGVVVYELKTTRHVKTLGPASLVNSLSVSNEPPYPLAVGTPEGCIMTFDVSSSQTSPDSEWSHLSSQASESILGLSFASDNKLAVLSKSCLAIYQWKTKSSVLEIPLEENEATCMSWNGSMAAVGLKSGNVILYDCSRGARVAALQTSEPVRRIAFPRSAPSRPVETPRSTLPFRNSQPRSSPDGMSDLDSRREDQVIVLRQELDIFRDEMEESFRNLHVDMLRQFQLQSEELNRVLMRQAEAMDRLAEDNRALRDENRHLREQRGDPMRD